MLLECGTAAIEQGDLKSLYSSDRIGEVHDGYWIGEMAMFAGESKRRATIKAITVCKVQRLYNKELVRLLGIFPTERQRFRQLAEHRLRAVEKEALEDHAFFKDLDRVFLKLLVQKCRAQVFFANEVLMKQGETADSLFILGRDSFVTLIVDGSEVKKLMGRACLGTKALLSPRPVKRASTAITQTVCAVRTLTREDWLDALKLHPEHQRWLASFTRDQMGKVGEARTTFQKKRAWEMIHHREMAATALHCDRLTDPELYVRQRRTMRSRRLPTLTPGNSLADTQVTATEELEGDTSAVAEESSMAMVSKHAQALPETWECFNGSQVVVPHTKLPQLGTNVEEQQEDDLDGRQLSRSESHDSYTFSDCEEALGMAAQR
jgi:CRP-like cAMP-binding protein